MKISSDLRDVSGELKRTYGVWGPLGDAGAFWTHSRSFMEHQGSFRGSQKNPRGFQENPRFQGCFMGSQENSEAFQKVLEAFQGLSGDFRRSQEFQGCSGSLSMF